MNIQKSNDVAVRAYVCYVCARVDRRARRGGACLCRTHVLRVYEIPNISTRTQNSKANLVKWYLVVEIESCSRPAPTAPSRRTNPFRFALPLFQLLRGCRVTGLLTLAFSPGLRTLPGLSRASLMCLTLPKSRVAFHV